MKKCAYHKTGLFFFQTNKIQKAFLKEFNPVYAQCHSQSVGILGIKTPVFSGIMFLL